MSYVAEFLPLTLDSQEVLQNEWQNLVNHVKGLTWHNRMYFQKSQFTDYFKNIITQITDVIQLPVLDITLQTHDKSLHDTTIELNVTHSDGYRSTNITIPVYASRYETVNWHDQSNMNILQSSVYSIKHPSLVNVENVHSVSLVPNEKRILIQLSFRENFEQICNMYPGIFRVYK